MKSQLQDIAASLLLGIAYTLIVLFIIVPFILAVQDLFIQKSPYFVP